MSVQERQPLRVLGDGTIADDFHEQVRRTFQFHVTVRFAACICTRRTRPESKASSET